MTEHTYYLPFSTPIKTARSIPEADRDREEFALSACYRAMVGGGSELDARPETKREI
jgi:hypothetical protein